MNPSSATCLSLLALFAVSFSLAQQSPANGGVAQTQPSTVHVEPRKPITEYLVKVTTLSAAAEAEKKLNPNLTLLLTQARQKMQSGDFGAAIVLMHEALAARQHEALFWITLGDAQCWTKSYADAVSSYTNALASPIQTANPEQLSAATENNMGVALAALRRTSESIEAFGAAARHDPAKAAVYFTNEAFVIESMGAAGAVQAADKAIAADPTFASAYYIRAEVMVERSTVDPTTQKIVTPPGCVESFQRYLDLQPNGEFAPEVRDILASIGQLSHAHYSNTAKTSALP